MARKLIISGIALVAASFALPAHAVDEFYIVRNRTTNECRVVQERPTDMKEIVVSNTAYASEENAVAALKTVCTKH
jgi:hypothetical protein